MQAIVFKLPLAEMLAKLRQALADAGLLLVQERDYPASLLPAGPPLRHLLVLDPTTVGQVTDRNLAQVPEALLLLLVQAQGATQTALAWDEPLGTGPPASPLVAATQAELQRRLNLVLVDLRHEATVLGLAANPTLNDW